MVNIISAVKKKRILNSHDETQQRCYDRKRNKIYYLRQYCI